MTTTQVPTATHQTLLIKRPNTVLVLMRKLTGMKSTTSPTWIRGAIAVVALVALAALASAQSPVKPQSLYSPPENMAELLAEVTAASYMVGCGTGSGSGWGLKTTWEGKEVEYIVTNHHVIKDCLQSQSPTVTSSEGFESEAEVVAFKRRAAIFSSSQHATDLALLRPTDFGISGLTELATEFPLGSWVLTSSYPGVGAFGNPHTITTGVISSVVELEGLSTTATVNRGSSGGVVVNARGEVVGTIYQGSDQDLLQDTGLFLSTPQLLELLAIAHDQGASNTGAKK